MKKGDLRVAFFISLKYIPANTQPECGSGLARESGVSAIE
jgi:hypothetical protein